MLKASSFSLPPTLSEPKCINPIADITSHHKPDIGRPSLFSPKLLLLEASTVKLNECSLKLNHFPLKILR